MRWVTLLAVCAMRLSAPASTQQFTPIGSFDNVRVSTSHDPHCYGWSLTLWQYGGRVVGLLDQHQGLCGDPMCRALTDVSHDPKSGRLGFSAFERRFTGRLTMNGVTGTLGAEHLHLKRNHDRMDAKWDWDIHAWCEFWRTVPRCQGVADFCSSVEVPEQ
jgi:hypothetical protein